MTLYSTTQAAKRLGIAPGTLSRYVADKKVPSPKFMQSGQVTHHVWTESEIEMLRKILPKIANGRKTRWQRRRGKQKTQPRAPQPPKTARAGDSGAALSKKGETKKKK